MPFTAGCSGCAECEILWNSYDRLSNGDANLAQYDRQYNDQDTPYRNIGILKIQ